MVISDSLQPIYHSIMFAPQNPQMSLNEKGDEVQVNVGIKMLCIPFIQRE